jgi:RNA polymerase primary sigma factor
VSTPKPPKPYVPHPDFSHPGIEHELFAPPLPALPPVLHYDPDGRSSVTVPVLTRDEERLRFMQYNFARLRHHSALPNDFATWAERVAHLSEYLVRCNVGLVCAALSRRPPAEPHEAFSEGMAALLRSVERFDVSRGWKFSSYATQSIHNALGHYAMRSGKRAKRLPTTELTDKVAACIGHDAPPSASAELADEVAKLRAVLTANTAGLTADERFTVEHRFLNGKATLQDVANSLGCTRENARRLEGRALQKLRAVLS